jgi:hypothetical protein
VGLQGTWGRDINIQQTFKWNLGASIVEIKLLKKKMHLKKTANLALSSMSKFIGCQP